MDACLLISWKKQNNNLDSYVVNGTTWKEWWYKQKQKLSFYMQWKSAALQVPCFTLLQRAELMHETSSSVLRTTSICPSVWPLWWCWAQSFEFSTFTHSLFHFLKESLSNVSAVMFVIKINMVRGTNWQYSLNWVGGIINLKRQTVKNKSVIKI